MALRVNFNPAAILAQSQLTRADRSLTASIERLASGLRINRAADDPAGMTIANILRHDLAAMREATNNAEEGVNLVQTAEGALDETGAMLVKMRALALDAANDAVNDDAQLQAIQTEMDDLIDSIQRIAEDTRFGSLPLLDGSMAGTTLSSTATRYLESVDFDATRLPGGIQDGSTLTLSAPSGDLQRESLSVTFLDGGSPAADTATIDGLTQNGTALSVAGGESITITGPDGSATLTLANTTTVGDLASLINANDSRTGLRAAYDETTGAFTLESRSFGFGAIDVATNDDLSGGSNVGLLDDDTTSTLNNGLRPTRDRFAMTLTDPGTANPASTDDLLVNIEGNGTRFDAVEGKTLTIYGLGEAVDIDLGTFTTIRDVVDAINATRATTGAIANYDATTGTLSVEGGQGPIFVSSADLTASGSQIGLLDERTDLVNDVGSTRTATSANVTATLTYTDESGSQRNVTLTQVPTRDGGRTLVNLLPGAEGVPPYTAYESGAFSVVVEDSSDGSIGSTITAPTTDLTATRRSPTFFQIGSRTGDTLDLDIPDMRAGALGRSAGLAAEGYADLADLHSRAGEAIINRDPEEALRVIDAAIEEVSAARGRLGATQANGLERSLASLRITTENMTAAESRIRDIDFALESAQFARFNIRLQAATAMLAQANQTPQSVLQLLQ